jgi:hypothetical protein
MPPPTLRHERVRMFGERDEPDAAAAVPKQIAVDQPVSDQERIVEASHEAEPESWDRTRRQESGVQLGDGSHLTAIIGIEHHELARRRRRRPSIDRSVTRRKRCTA